MKSTSSKPRIEEASVQKNCYPKPRRGNAMKIFRWARSSIGMQARTLLTETAIVFFLSILVYFKPGLLVRVAIYLVGQKELEDLISKTGLSVNLQLVNFDDYIRPMALALIILGGATSAIFMLGMHVSKSHDISLAGLYFVLTLGMLFFVLVVMAAFTWKKHAVREILRPGFQRSLEKYAGDRSEDNISLVWNLMMILMQCCGINNYQDFQKLKNWNAMHTKSNQTAELLTPIVCCKERTGDVNFECAIKGTASDKNNWATHGCLDTVTEALTSSLSALLILLIHFMYLLLTVFVTVFTLVELVMDSLRPL